MIYKNVILWHHIMLNLSKIYITPKPSTSTIYHPPPLPLPLFLIQFVDTCLDVG